MFSRLVRAFASAVALAACTCSANAGVLGVQLTQPFAVYNGPGVLTYSAATRNLDITAILLAVQFDGVALAQPFTPGSVQIHVRVGANGRLIGGQNGNDLVVTGNIDVDGDGINEYTGVLLTAEVTAFGFQDSGAGGSTDNFDFKFRTTGGSLAGVFGETIGVNMISENSTFNNSFCANFGGGAKGTIGTIDGHDCPRSPGYWKTHVCDWPFDCLNIGGVVYNHNQINNLLNNKNPNGTNGSNNPSSRLAKFVVTAKFDLLSGAIAGTSGIVDLISQADALLSKYPPGSSVSATIAAQIDAVKNALDQYVNSSPAGCGGTDCHSGGDCGGDRGGDDCHGGDGHDGGDCHDGDGHDGGGSGCGGGDGHGGGGGGGGCGRP